MQLLALFSLLLVSQAVAGPVDRFLKSSWVSGEARWGVQNNTAGACSVVHKDRDLVAALNLKLYGAPHTISKMCGRTLEVTSKVTKERVHLSVADLCTGDGCGRNPYNLVLSKGAFRQLSKNHLDKGVLDVEWRLLEEGTSASAPVEAEPTVPYSPPLLPDPLMPEATYGDYDGTNLSQSSSVLEEATTFTPAEPTTATTQSTSVGPPDEEATPSTVSLPDEEATTSTQSSMPVIEAPTTSKTKVKHTPTTTWTPETPATSSDDSAPTQGGSDSGSEPAADWTTSEATYYYQEGNPGACGYYAKDDELVVALSFEFFDSGDYCGKPITIKHGDDVIQATIRDKCEACIGKSHIDLSIAAFKSLSSLEPGVIPIEFALGAY